jgi:hypothetical protein
MDATKEQHQILCKSRKKYDGDPILAETEKEETGEEQSQEHAHHCV